jgi:hypothetical protein
LSILETEARVAEVAARQLGAFTRGQALQAGFSAAQVQRRLAAGIWVRMHPRVYRHAGTPGDRALALTAALLWAGPDAVLSHTTAAALWRIGADAPALIELLVPCRRGPRASGVVVHRVARLERADVTVRGAGLPVTTPVRTLIDLAAVVTATELAAILDRARARGLVTRRALQARLDDVGTRGRPGTAGLRALLGTCGSASVHASARMDG